MALVQTACPASTGNYDITDSGATPPAGDMVGALFFDAATASDNANTASVRWSLGATDLTGNICVGMGAQDATAGAGIRSMLSNTNCVFTPNGQGAQTPPVAAYGSTLSAGVRLTTSAVFTGRLLNTLLISGTDTAMKVGSQLFGVSDTNKVITHGLGGTPDLIMVLCSFGQSVNEGDGSGFSVGFWDRRTGNQSSVSYRATDLANPTDNASYASSASVGEVLAASSTLAHVTLTSVGSTSFTIHLSAATGTSNYFGWIALRGSSLQLFTKNQLTAVPTSTGNSTIMAGMTGRPQCYIALPTRMITANTVITDDSAGAFGCSVAATNDYTVTTQGANAATFKDAVATSVAIHIISNTFGVLELDNTGAPDYQGTWTSWDSGGVTVNYSNVPASLAQMAVLAFGAQVPVSSSLLIPRHIFRPVNTVYYPR